MSLATVASVIGIGAGGLSLFNGLRGGGGQQGGSSNASTYVPTGLGSADQTWQQVLQQLTGGAGGLAGVANPAILQAFNRMMGIDTGPLVNAGRNSGDYLFNLAGNQDAMHNNLVNQGNQAGAAGTQLWQTALDPQNALRNQLQQQVTDASRAGTTARGIGMSPQAAGIENQDVSNFLINWQNQQLGRQIAAAQGMGQAYDQAGRDYTGGSNLATSAAGNLLQSQLTPYQIQQMAYGSPLQYAQQAAGAQGGIDQQLGGVLSAIIPYLNSGQGATSQLFGQNQANLSNTMSGLYGIARYLPNVFQGGNNSGNVPYDPSAYNTGGYDSTPGSGP